MTYEVEDMKNLLAGLEDELESIVYTEHFLEKIGHRCIEDAFVDNLILSSQPIGIDKIPNCRNRFKLRFGLGNGRDLIVVASIFIGRSVLLVSAFSEKAKGGAGRDNN